MKQRRSNALDEPAVNTQFMTIQKYPTALNSKSLAPAITAPTIMTNTEITVSRLTLIQRQQQ